MNENNIDNNCIFCKVGKGEIPHNRISENENFVAFLDIHPLSKGHTLIIPKKHVVWMQETDDDTISKIFVFSKKLMQKIKSGLNCDYVQVVVEGENVAHFHIHLIPRYSGDKLIAYPEPKKYEKDEEKEIISKITLKL